MQPERERNPGAAGGDLFIVDDTPANLGLLATILREHWLQARAVVGFFPCNAVDEEIEVYSDTTRSRVLHRLHHLRQQKAKPSGQPHYALSDFIAPKESGKVDYIGAFAVTAGIGIEEHLKRFMAAHDDYNDILLKSLADRLAEASAEALHLRVRRELWGYAPEERLTNDQLIAEHRLSEEEAVEAIHDLVVTNPRRAFKL